MREKRKVLKKMAKCTEGEEKKIVIARRKIIMDYICQIKRAHKRKKAMEVAKTLKKEGGFDANVFWKHAKTMNGRKTEIAASICYTEGKIENNHGKIEEIYIENFAKGY